MARSQPLFATDSLEQVALPHLDQMADRIVDENALIAGVQPGFPMKRATTVVQLLLHIVER